MKKFITIAGICCALPLIIVAIIALSGQKSSTTKQSENAPVSAIVEGTPSVEALFPDFSLTEVSGETITRDSLKGKPTIVWFTATWCTPCQIGAKKVAQLQKELGDDKLNVLVVFVDPKESASDLRNWRNQFAHPDWKLAFDNGLAEKIGIRYLDSKYLLGSDGVIQDFNTSIADDQYLALIRSAVNASK
ncbi:MAG: TlpA family protein disulfide reductase [Candidatus Kerfeldbacteria bacterium]|nr:TlpA family protein disulfide reductase [Candidatus Kerfeldbacteria bacterium]